MHGSKPSHWQGEVLNEALLKCPYNLRIAGLWDSVKWRIIIYCGGCGHGAPWHGSYFPFSACCHIVCFYRRDLFPMQGSLKGHLAPTPERPPGRPRVYSLAISNILPRFSSPTYRPLISSCFPSRNLPSSRVFQHISRMPAQRNKNSKRSKRSAGERVN